MAIPTVMGTEVEYGIIVKNDPDFDPISSCVLLVNAYKEDPEGRILWDYDQENPLADARGSQVDNPTCPRAGIPIGMNMGHHIVAQFLLVLTGFFNIHVIEMGTHFLQLGVADLESQFLLGFGQRQPELSP